MPTVTVGLQGEEYVCDETKPGAQDCKAMQETVPQLAAFGAEVHRTISSMVHGPEDVSGLCFCQCAGLSILG